MLTGLNCICSQRNSVAIFLFNTGHKKKGLENTFFIDMMMERTDFFPFSVNIL